MRFRRRRARKQNRLRQKSVRQCAYFFIPLLQPLNIEDGAVCRFADDIDPDSLSEFDSLTLGTFYSEFGHMKDMSLSLRFHQVSSGGPDVRFLAAMDAVGKAFPAGEPVRNNDGEPDNADSIVTVAEAAVPLENDDEQSLSPAFDHAIECIRKVQLGYARATGEPITQISRLQVPFAVPLAVREFQFDESAPKWPQPEQIRIFLTNAHDSFLKGAAIASQPKPHDFDQIMHATRVSYEGPFARAHQLTEKAASFADHDNTVGSVLLGAATEMLVLDLAISLLWEKGLDPQDASSEVLTRQFRTHSAEHILRGPIRKALGEAWNLLEDEGTLAFLAEVMRLRNIAVHQGDEPPDNEIRSAFQANREFLRRIEFALVTQLELYPLTTSTLIAREKLGSLGRLQELEDALEKTLRPLDNWGAYMAYRFEVMRPYTRIGVGTHGELIGDTEASNVALLVHPDGKERWWLLDEEANVACPAMSPTVNREQRAALRTVRRKRQRFAATGTGADAILMKGVEATPRFDPPTWYRIGDVWPMRRWNRYPTWPLPYPLVLED